MKNKKPILLALGAAALVLVVALVCLGLRIIPTASHAIRISELMQPMLKAENKAMHLAVELKTDGKPLALESDIYLVTEDGASYLAIERGGSAVYMAENVLYLQNGKAFRIGGQLQNQTMAYADLLPRIGALFEALKIETEETEDGSIYRIRVTGEEAERLLGAVSPAQTLPAGSIRKLEVCFIEREGKPERITISGSGELKNSTVALYAEISDFRILTSGEYPIPEAVKRSAATVDPDELLSLTEDLYRLVLALAPLSDMQKLQGKLELAVDCGLIQLDHTMDLAALKNTSQPQIDPQALQALPEVLGLLCLEGDIRCSGSNGSYTYSLTLDRDSMQKLSRMILPEIANYAGEPTEGNVTIVLEDNSVASMEVSVGGKIKVLIAAIPMKIAARFLFEH